MRAERPQRRAQSRTFRKESDAADAAIHMPGCHADAFVGRPRLDARTLSLGREPLFLRGCTVDARRYATATWGWPKMVSLLMDRNHDFAARFGGPSTVPARP
jgi:hypothetical protein